MTDYGIRRDLSTAKISIMGVVKAMKNREHMPPKVLAMRRSGQVCSFLPYGQVDAEELH